MTIINDSIVVIFSYDELKNVLENSNNYNYVYIGENITLTSGIKINSSKVNLTIDGYYNNSIHELIDQKKLGSSDGIYVSNPNTLNVTVKNLNITGYNYYGIIFVPDNSSYRNITIEYNNINYTGPQLSFNPHGLTRFIDSVITIKDNYASGNEIAECNRIEIGGFTTINHLSTSNSSFWFRNSNPSFTILKNSVVHFTSKYRELIYGVTNLEFKIEENSEFYLTSYSGFGYGTYGSGNTLIDENSSLYITQTNNNRSYASWYSYGMITLNKGASLTMYNTSNTNASNYNIYFMGNNSGITLNNPEKVVLCNKSSNIFNSQNLSTFNFTFNRINLFNTLIDLLKNISIDTLPTYSWYKENNLSNISGTFNSSTTNISQNDFTLDELKNLPDLSNFSFQNKKILSIGLFPFILSPITDSDTTFHGVTESNASILIEYDSKNVVVNADENGNFDYNFDNALPIGTNIKFTTKTYEDALYYTKIVQIVYSGEIVIESATKHFQFELYAISNDPVLCPRQNYLSVVVADSRVKGTDWELYASIDEELTSSDGKKLNGSLVFVDENDNITTLSSTPTLVYTGFSNEGITTKTIVDFEEDKGILLKVVTPLENNVYYQSKIIWTIKY